MTLLEQYLAEKQKTVDEIVASVPVQQKKPVDVFIGRTNPPHLGHKKIIDMMNNPVIILVKGAKSSQDKDRNPLPEKYQIQLLKKLSPKAKIIVASAGYLPAIFIELREMGLEPKTLLAGDDRMKGYQGQINGINKKLDSDKQFNMSYKLTPRVTSATIVRKALKDDDISTFEKNMPKEFYKEYSKMRKYVK